MTALRFTRAGIALLWLGFLTASCSPDTNRQPVDENSASPDSSVEVADRDAFRDEPDGEPLTDGARADWGTDALMQTDVPVGGELSDQTGLVDFGEPDLADGDAADVDVEESDDTDLDATDLHATELDATELDIGPFDLPPDGDVPPDIESPIDCNLDGQDDQCPLLPGYVRTCNPRQRCEYANLDVTGWKKWDVWIWIPPGTFLMGSEGEGGPPEEQPIHAVTFSAGFFIAKFEIVVEQYEACVAAGACFPPDTSMWNGNGWGTNASGNGRADHPQNGLSWQRARDFCAWLVSGGRLPTEAEREYAATGPVHMKYPWGAGPEPTCSNGTAVFNEVGGPGGFGCGTGGTWPVGSKTAGMSWSGGMDMSGNLWEWCEDWYHPGYAGAPADGSAWLDMAENKKVIRGGSFDYPPIHLRSAGRHGTWPEGNHAAFGGRCAHALQ